jgi:hypothetical protein
MMARRVHTIRDMANEISWTHDFDAALASAGDKLVLIDFTAAPM